MDFTVPYPSPAITGRNCDTTINFRKEHLKLTEEEFKEIADKIYTEFKKL